MNNFMKTKVRVLALVLMTCFSFQLPALLPNWLGGGGDECCDPCAKPCCNPCDECCDSFDFYQGWDVEFRVAAFYPQRKRFREIYDKWGANYQVQIDKDIMCGIGGWANVTWYTKRGHSIGLHDRTRIRLVPISFGLKYTYTFCDCWNIYAGIGPCFTWMNIRDHSCFVHKHTKKVSCGGTSKLGLIYECDCWFIDLFADYSYQPFSFRDHHRRHRSGEGSSSFVGSSDSSDSGHHRRVHRNDTNTGGWSLGIGIGYKL